MVAGKLMCPKCDCNLKRYDCVKRIIRHEGGKKEYILVERYQCPRCKSIHRILPNNLYPYKQYEADIIDGVIEELIDSSILGYEDYPSEATMKRWKRQMVGNISTEVVLTKDES